MGSAGDGGPRSDHRALIALPTTRNDHTHRPRPTTTRTSSNPPSDTADAIAAFRSKLLGLGYIEGQSRFAEGEHGRLDQLAADLAV